jgi:chemotaxis protein CheZ
MRERSDGPAPPTAQLQQRLAAHQQAAQTPYAIERVVREVMITMRGDLSGNDISLLSEVEELGRTIAAAKAEIAALGVDDIIASHIPSATDELDAIVAHTAAATNAILEMCETLDVLAGGLSGASAEALSDATTHIYEACSFQDITGQRIAKVVATLKAIDSKVLHIIEAFGGAARQAGAEMAEPQSGAESHLLNGPQLTTIAMDQSEIDTLLASFE